MLEWLSVCSEVQMISIQPSWCRCHPIISCYIRLSPGKEAVKWVSVTVKHNNQNQHTRMHNCFTAIIQVNLCGPAWHGSATGRALDFAISRSRVQILLQATLRNNLGQVVYTYVPLPPSSITWYRPKDGDALRLGRSPQAWRKVMAAYHWVDDLRAAGWLPVHRDQLRAQRLVSSMGKPLPFIFTCVGQHPTILKNVAEATSYWLRASAERK